MAFVQLVTDNFTRANEDPLGNGNWTTCTASVAPKIVSNVCVPHAAGGAQGSASYWSGPVVQTGGTWPADQYAESTLGPAFVAAQQFSDCCIVRQSAAADTYYYVQCNAATNMTMNKKVAGVNTALGAAYGHVGAAGDVIRLEVAGSTLTLYVNGSQLGTTRSDSAIASGSPGLGVYTSAGQTLADSSISLWAAGANQAAAPTASPNGGNISGATNVTLTSASGGTIYYTTDGSTPTHSSNSIASGNTISVSVTTTVKFFAAAATFADSTLSTVTFTLVTSHSISGNAGIAGATVSYGLSLLELESGDFLLLENTTGDLVLEAGASGSVTADGSGNYTISGLQDGDYMIIPSKTGYSFTPTYRDEVLSGADLTGVDFTATFVGVGGGSFMQAFRNFANKRGGGQR